MLNNVHETSADSSHKFTMIASKLTKHDDFKMDLNEIEGSGGVSDLVENPFNEDKEN
jgi:hypothetical protein